MYEAYMDRMQTQGYNLSTKFYEAEIGQQQKIVDNLSQKYIAMKRNFANLVADPNSGIKEGFIPRFYSEGPNDRVDETLLDLKNYTHSLVVEEMNLGNLIENAVKEMAKEEAKEEDEDIEEELSYDNLDELKDEDYEDYNETLRYLTADATIVSKEKVEYIEFGKIIKDKLINEYNLNDEEAANISY